LSVRRWRTLSDLLKLLDRSAPQLRSVDAVFVPAALSDFTLRAAPGKIASRTNPKLRLDLARAPKLLPRLRRLVRPPAWTIGFKLEVGRTDAELRSAALAFRAEHGLDWVVANDRATMGSDRSDALIAGPQGRTHWVHGAKLEVAGKLLDDLGASLPPVGIPASGARGAAARSPRRAASSRRGTPSKRRPRSV
ncbi:MAG TPA: phosphopantothenoylcysteine decarboxylase, partial [Thermoplasmata archaeon]|nr:phosphopantothenoylcysteine decarboxylase [Thermoplasmata archaeon]